MKRLGLLFCLLLFFLPLTNFAQLNDTMVGLSVEGNNIMIFWDTTGLTNITKFEVYRESSTPGDFSILVGEVPFNNALPYITDSNVDVNTSSYSYKIAAVNGSNKLYSNPIKSVHLIGGKFENSLQLSWNKYQTAEPTQYLIIETNPIWNKYDSVPSNIDSYTLFSYDLTKTNSYKVCACLNHIFASKISTTKADYGPFMYSCSNELVFDLNTALNSTQSNPITIEYNSFNSNVSIFSESDISEVIIVDINGREVCGLDVQQNTKELNLKLPNLNWGVYILKVCSGNYIATKSISVNRK